MLGREVEDADAADLEMPGPGPGHGPRPELRHQGVHILGRPQPGRTPLSEVAVQRPGLMRSHPYILSGAETPSRAKPLAITVRVASLSQSRATLTSVTGSSPLGDTGHLS